LIEAQGIMYPLPLTQEKMIRSRSIGKGDLLPRPAKKWRKSSPVSKDCLPPLSSSSKLLINTRKASQMQCKIWYDCRHKKWMAKKNWKVGGTSEIFRWFVS
jgi:hypothetical protein